MRGMTCRSTLRLLSKRASGLSDVEKLHLEDHLQVCPDCRADERSLTALTNLHRSMDGSVLSQRARDRALAAALRGESPTVAPLEPSPSRRVFWPALAIGAAAAAAVLVFTLRSQSDGIALSEKTTEQVDGIALSKHDVPTKVDGIALSKKSDEPSKLDGIALSATGKLISGSVRVAGIALSVQGDPIPSDAEVSTEHGAEVIFDRARVSMHANTVLTWNAPRDTVELRSGTVRATVVSVPNRRFRIATQRFVAVVVGTELEVDAKRVKVYQGTVQVVSPSGKVLAASITAGHEWTIDEPKVAAKSAPKKKTESVDPRAELSRARGLLAARDIPGARASIRKVLRATKKARYAAEARTLLAECALVSGDRPGAILLYLNVANRYRRMAAGQNALFAAARLEARSGQKSAARRHLELYLKRYPNGSFSAEATKRLERMK